VAGYGESIPKLIHSLWFQGRDNAPDLVRLNFARWARLNPDYRLQVLERRDVEALLDGYGIAIAGLGPAALSDIVRARLLLDHGGIWVDASLFPVEPLDQWLDHMLTPSGFFAFERPGPDRPISTWFLVATPGNPIFHKWWGETTRFWSKPRRLVEGIPADPAGSVSPEVAAANEVYPYFWFHYLFAHLLKTDAEVEALWRNCVKCSARSPHQLQFLFARRGKPSEARIRKAAACAPVQKLNWRASYPLDVLDRLASLPLRPSGEQGPAAELIRLAFSKLWKRGDGRGR